MQALEVFCRRLFPEQVSPRVANLHQLTGGWETEVHAFDLESGADCTPLIVRMYPGEHAAAKATREFYVLKQLFDAQFPVPAAYAVETDGSILGKPFLLMERIDGPSVRDRMPAVPDADREALRSAYCGLLVTLHHLDWRPFADDAVGVPGRYTFADELLGVERRALVEPHLEGFRPVLQWLEERRDDVPCARPAVIHGDPHLSNVLVRADNSLVLIDWTGCGVSDPRVDVSRSLLLIRAYGNEARRRMFLAEYERQAGAPLDHMEWFDALACLSRLRDVVTALSQGPLQSGWRDDIAEVVRTHHEGTQRTYEFLVERTGIRVPEVEQALLPPV